MVDSSRQAEKLWQRVNRTRRGMRRPNVMTRQDDAAAPVEHHGGTDVIDAFIEHDYRRVVGTVSLITGDRGRAEDAVQDALVKALRRSEPIDNLAAWVTVVASNGARSSHRRRASEERAYARAGDHGNASVPAPAAPDRELHDALAGLPQRERQVAVLHYASDLSVADCARVLGIADGTVKTLLSRARQHLAAALGDRDEQGGAA